jgi:hypothetical protein
VQQTCCYVVTAGKLQEGDRGLLVVDSEVCVPSTPSNSQVSRNSQLLQPGLMRLECTGNHVQYEGLHTLSCHAPCIFKFNCGFVCVTPPVCRRGWYPGQTQPDFSCNLETSVKQLQLPPLQQRLQRQLLHMLQNQRGLGRLLATRVLSPSCGSKSRYWGTHLLLAWPA